MELVDNHFTNRDSPIILLIDKPRDESVFTISLVPLKLLSGNKIVWENPQSSSTRLCSPIKLEFIKENDEIIRCEKENIENKIIYLQLI